MIAQALPFVLSIGAALAACPLSVHITDSENHILNVTVTNAGNTTLSVFKGNTVFSQHATRDLLVTDIEGNALPFAGIHVKYKTRGLDASLFQMIEAGQAITVAVDASQSYKLDGITRAKVAVIQGFRFATGTETPSQLSDLAKCEHLMSAEVEITPDKTTVAQHQISHVQERSVTYSCSAAQNRVLKTGVADAIHLAKLASNAARTGSGNFTVWFGSHSVQAKVQKIYDAVANVEATSVKISCEDFQNSCDGGPLFYACPTLNTIVLCQNLPYDFAELPRFATDCRYIDSDRAGSILHELTHLFGSKDYAYDFNKVIHLGAELASENAENLEMYAAGLPFGGCDALLPLE